MPQFVEFIKEFTFNTSNCIIILAITPSLLIHLIKLQKNNNKNIEQINKMYPTKSEPLTTFVVLCKPPLIDIKPTE